MPTTRVSVFKCGTKFPGWLDGAHPTVKDGEVYGKVCFSDHSKGCYHTTQIYVKNCSSYHIYKLYQTLLWHRLNMQRGVSIVIGFIIVVF